LTDPPGFNNERGRKGADCTMRKLDVGEYVPAQVGLGLRRQHYYGVLGWGNGYDYSHTVTVRIYRPGYQTIELKSWDPSQKLDWQPAPTYFGQLAALEQLVGTDEARRYWSANPGSVDHRHREALLFIAPEFERFVRTYRVDLPEENSKPHRTPKEHIEMRAADYRALADS